MSACISEQSISGADNDLRYFYPDEKRMARYSCGMTRQTPISVYRRYYTPWKNNIDQLLNVIRKSRNNRVQGFLMEQLCLQLIIQRGLRFIPDVDSNAPSGPLQKEIFLGTPDWSKLIDSQPQHNSRHLYLPQESNVDGGSSL